LDGTKISNKNFEESLDKMASIGMPIDMERQKSIMGRHAHGPQDEFPALHEDLVHSISAFLISQARENPNQLNQQILALKDH